MKRLTEKMVFCGLVTAWRLAAWPTRRSPVLENATTEGVVRAPSEFSSTEGSPPSMTAIQEFVVPRSIPRILDMENGWLCHWWLCTERSGNGDSWFELPFSKDRASARKQSQVAR